MNKNTKSFFDELSETITKTAQGFSTRVGGMYESQKVVNKIGSEERMVRKLMADMGKIIYERFTAGEEVDEEMAPFCEQIGQHMEKIESLKTESLRRKGQKICPECGKTVESGFAFCPFCGASVPTPEPEEIEEETEEEKEEAGEEAEEAGEEAEKAFEELENAAKEAADFVEKTAEEIADAAKDLFES